MQTDEGFSRDADGSLHGLLGDEAATLRLGEQIAGCLAPGVKVYLRGDLGAGKTTLVRGVLRGLGYAGRVKSPTFTLVETYNLSKLYLYHFDFYRLKGSDEWRDAGFREAFGEGAACLVEWPEKAAGLPAPDLVVHIEHAAQGRWAHLHPHSAWGTRCLAHLSG